MSNSDKTIRNMMQVLNPTQIPRTELFKSPIVETESPLKRRLSLDSSFGTPDKRQKIENVLDVSWIASPREARRMRTELLESRNLITDLETRIQQMHDARRVMETTLDNEIKKLEFQRNNDRKKVDELEKQMHSIRRREKEAQKELDEKEQEMLSMKTDYDNCVRELETKVTELQSQLDVYEDTEIDQINMMKTDNDALSEALKAAKKDAKFHKDLVGNLRGRLARLTNVSNEIEMKDQLVQTANLKIKQLEYTLESYGEWQIQYKVFCYN